ncbi:UNVERIFIED_CONTAM: hypothetical protein FKN15_055937 [Acipenser sinensis]
MLNSLYQSCRRPLPGITHSVPPIEGIKPPLTGRSPSFSFSRRYAASLRSPRYTLRADQVCVLTTRSGYVLCVAASPVLRYHGARIARDILISVRAPPVGGLARDPVCPNPQCRVKETHLKQVYAAEAQATRLANTASVLTVYLDVVLRDAPLPEPVALEMRLLSGTLLQISSLQGQAWLA